jgi:hypothetical protein
MMAMAWKVSTRLTLGLLRGKHRFTERPGHDNPFFMVYQSRQGCMYRSAPAADAACNERQLATSRFMTITSSHLIGKYNALM